jgi:hypothetical protein
MYRPIIGSGNSKLDEVQLQINRKNHVDKIIRARIQGDHKLSQTMYDQQYFGDPEYKQINNAKSIQLRNERYQEIQRVNRILYENMARIT